MKKQIYSILLSLIFLSVAGCNWTDVHTHSFRHVADSESTCTTKGYIEHWECQECHNVYTKKGCTSESTKEAVGKDLLPHDFVYTAESPSSCIEKGMKEHWECSYCNKLVLDENGDVEGSRKELELEDYGPHKPTNHEAGRAATCTASGLREHWICEVCNGIFLDANAENGTTEEGLVIDMLPHTLTHHDIVAPTCTSTGIKEHWICEVCNGIFLDANAVNGTTEEGLVIDMLPHTLTHHDIVAPTCTSTGIKEHWICEVCNGIFLDANAENGTTEEGLVIDMLPHTLTHHDRVAPTCIQTGMKEYWDCAVCKKIFLDAEANSETNADDLVLDMLPHEYKDENGYWTEDGGNTVYRNPCINCGGVPLKTAPIGTVGPAGGYIFYVEEDSGHDLTYYENSPSELPGVVFGFYRNFPSSAELQVGTSTALGTGKDNTNKLILAMGNAAYAYNSGTDEYLNTKTTSNYSAKACADYSVSVGGKVFDDWFLPSKVELVTFLTNIYKSGKYPLPGITQTQYQTSSEADNRADAYLFVSLTNLKSSSATKSVDKPILPIRSFDGGSAF